MRIIEMGRKLSVEEKAGIKRVLSYIDGGVNFVMLSENVFMFVDSNVSDAESVIKEVEDKAEEIFYDHPDFTTYYMQDKRMLLVMGEAGAFGKDEISEEEYEKKRFISGMRLRDEVFDACERAEIIAIIEVLERTESEE